jgi:hypothetical protein
MYSQQMVIDSTYNTYRLDTIKLNGTDKTIRAAAILPDGKVIIGGEFTRYNGHDVNRIARLNEDGSLDTTFIGQ